MVARIEGLPKENAWEGDFQQILADQLMEDPPEDGRPATEVLERAAREILPIALRFDHPRHFAFIPTTPTWPGVLADFMAAGYNVNLASWLMSSGPTQLELVVIDWFRVNPKDTDLDEEALEKINRNVLARVFWEDRAFMSSTSLRKRFSLRLCILNHTTTWDDVRETLEVIERFGKEALSKGEHDKT